MTDKYNALREALKSCNRNDYRTWPQLPPDKLEGLLNDLAAAEQELIKPLPIGELIQRLEGQTYEKWFSQSDLKGERVPFAFAYRYAGCETASGFEDWRNELSRERPADWMIETGKVTGLIELFTAQQLPVAPEGWQMVPIEPTEHMFVCGFESEPDKFFSPRDVWEEYEAMSGCGKAAHRAKLCWAAMLSAAPKFGDEPDNQN